MALLDVVNAWQGDPYAHLDTVAGLDLPHGSGVRHTPPRRALADLDVLPLPAWDLIDAEPYRTAWRGRHGRLSWNMATSRGCPYPCNWCAKPIFGRGYQQRSAASVAEEVLQLKQTIAPDHIWFADDIFGLTADWVSDFAGEIEKRGARTPFMMQSRVNLMRPDTVDALARAGAEEVWLGVESGSQKILDAMEKGTTVVAARKATQLLKSRGIRACWFVQLGYPSEEWEDLVATRDLINAEMPDDIGVSVSYPLPGTRFYDLVQAELGAKRNWKDSGDLAMLFQGTYRSDFYRMVRDILHDEVRTGVPDDGRWAALAVRGAACRSERPVLLATGS
jgi:anaerobic magnesium-protoporphyrin IX monomethyl ester cyclase